MIIENAWYVAAWADEVTSTPMARRICNEPVVLFRAFDGKPAALRDACSHRGAPLSLGTVVQDGIRCNYHGVVFGCDGKCVRIPNQDFIPDKAIVRNFPIVEKNQLLWIWIGDPAEADESRIIDYPYHDDSANWPHKHGMMSTACHYLMLVDNLLDGTHLAYVHPDTVGGGAPDVHMKAEMTFKPTPTGMRLERLMRKAPPPPAYSACVEFPGDVDRWQEFDFELPSVVLQYSGAVVSGEDRSAARGPRFDMRLFHAATPETDTTCFYFWSAANGHLTNDPEATNLIAEQIVGALAEDKIFVEAQQKRITEFGEDFLFDNTADGPRMMARRAVNRVLKAAV